VNITPLDIRKQTFKRVFRGYDPEETQAFLEMLAEEFERLNREAIDLREKQSSLQTEVDHFRSMEMTLKEMLRTAQQAAEEVKENGRKEARLIVKEAEIRGNRAIEKARTHVHVIRSEIIDLKNQRDMYVSKFQALVQAQGDFLAQLQFSDPDVVQEAVPDIDSTKKDASA
jgi:cell division initiation protein